MKWISASRSDAFGVWPAEKVATLMASICSEERAVMDSIVMRSRWLKFCSWP